MYFQILPVVQRGSKAEILYATLKQSPLWENVKQFKLTENMRLLTGGPEVKEFADYLVSIGDGSETTYPEIGEDMVKIPDDLKAKATNLKDFCDEIFKGKQSKVIDIGIMPTIMFFC